MSETAFKAVYYGHPRFADWKTVVCPNDTKATASTSFAPSETIGPDEAELARERTVIGAWVIADDALAFAGSDKPYVVAVELAYETTAAGPPRGFKVGSSPGPGLITQARLNSLNEKIVFLDQCVVVDVVP